MTDTLIGNSITIDGELESQEDLVVLGNIVGKMILQANLMVTESGEVNAEVHARNADISGVVRGNLTADGKVQLQRQCRMVGNIKAPRILIEDGASFRGNVDMELASFEEQSL
jgi:cytoskeletal protein CcmA (bactofilin family)